MNVYLLEQTDIDETYYPFLFEKKPNQVITIGFNQIEEEDRKFLLSFVKSEQQYPIYVTMHVPRFMENDIIEDFIEKKILFEKKVIKKDIYLNIQVKEESQVDIVFENAYILGCMSQFVSWSFDSSTFIELKVIEKEYFFGMFKRTYSLPKMILEDQSTFFWIHSDGSSIEVFSTDKNWKGIKQVKQRYSHLF
jgi:hypothetical protein